TGPIAWISLIHPNHSSPRSNADWNRVSPKNSASPVGGWSRRAGRRRRGNSSGSSMNNGNRPRVVLDARVVTGTGGGPDKTILNSPRFLAPLGYHMVCAYLHPPGDPGFEVLRHKAEQLGAPLVAVPDRGPLDWRVFTGLLRVCRRERVAIY